MIYLFYTVHIIICLFLILVVLLQQGKGADLSVFGGGGTQTVFGARGAATILHKLTVGGFIAFIVTTVAIGLLSSSGSGSSVMTGVPAQEETAPDAAPAAPAADEGGEALESSDDAAGVIEVGESSTDEAPPEETGAPAEAEVEGSETPPPPSQE